MFTKIILILGVILSAVFVPTAYAEPVKEPKGLINAMMEMASWQIKLLIQTVENLVNAQLKILDDIRQGILTIIQHSIDTTNKLIDFVIVKTTNQIRTILQVAVDKGLNVTECAVLNFDKLRILRRRLVLAEIQCATSQVGEFYDIIDGATKNFTDDLAMVFGLPMKLQKCLITITPISCVTKIVEEVSTLNKIIPRQILGTMLEVTQYLNGFDTRVHKCQFNQFREALLGTRRILDELLECVYHGNAEGIGTDNSSNLVSDDTMTEISELIK